MSSKSLTCTCSPCICSRPLSSPQQKIIRLTYSRKFANCLSLQPDSESSVCDEPACTRYFTYFRRRHHCRRCGNIFCDMHSLYTIPLDQDANYHPRGSRSRSCEHCWSEYRGWQIARSSRSNSESSQDDPQTPTTPTVVCAGNGAKSALGSVFGKGQGMSESLAASVPRDWNWSTF